MSDAPARMGIEQRRFRRVYFAFLAEVSDGVRTVRGRCQRVSTSGLYVFVPEVFEEGRHLRLRFVLPGQSAAEEVEGRVLRSRAENPDAGTLGGMLVLFERLMPDADAAIREFVLNCLVREREYEGSVLPSEGPDDGAPAAIPVRFFGTDQPGDEYVVNISEGGAFVRTLRPLPAGSVTLADLYLPGADRVTRLNARVAWSRAFDPAAPGTSGMGIEFQGVGPETSEALRAFVDRFGNEAA